MKIYVAGSWKNRKNIKLTWIERLTDLGHTITHDWTEMEDDRLSKIGNPLRDIKYHKKCAHEDVNGVINADVLIAIMDSAVKYYSYRGTWTEIGVALGKGIPIILYNPWIDDDDINEMAKYSRNVTNVFFWHDSITRVTTGNQVFKELEKIKNEKLEKGKFDFSTTFPVHENYKYSNSLTDEEDEDEILIKICKQVY